MSRIGKIPVTIPEAVNVTIDGRTINASGPKGALVITHTQEVMVTHDNNQLTIAPTGGSKQHQQQYGLMRTLIANLVQGVATGFERKLEVNGVGYRVAVSGRKLTLHLGYSHPIEYTLPDGIEAVVEGNTITVRGSDKQLVGQVAAHIRAQRKPEPYKGKGIKYQEERIRRKAGKTAGK